MARVVVVCCVSTCLLFLLRAPDVCLSAASVSVCVFSSSFFSSFFVVFLFLSHVSSVCISICVCMCVGGWVLRRFFVVGSAASLKDFSRTVGPALLQCTTLDPTEEITLKVVSEFEYGFATQEGNMVRLSLSLSLSLSFSLSLFLSLSLSLSPC
jgi:hypothetical protein